MFFKQKPAAVTVASCAIASRVATLALMVLANELLPTQNATGVHLFRSTEYPVPARPGGGGPLAAFTRWDSAWFLSIADCSYPAAQSSVQRQAGGTTTSFIDCTGTERAWGGAAYDHGFQMGRRRDASSCHADVSLEEQAHAFFPLYPWLVSLAGRGFSLFLSGLFGRGDCLILAAVMISNVCFVVAAVLLYHLGRIVTGDSRLALGGALVFCASPASVFFSTAYTGSLYSALTFAGLLVLFSDSFCMTGETNRGVTVRNQIPMQGMVNASMKCRRGWQGAIRAWISATLFAAATLARSNGIAAAGVLALEKLRWMADEADLFAATSRTTTGPRQGVTTRAAVGRINLSATRSFYTNVQWRALPWTRLMTSLVSTGLQVLLVIAPYVLVQIYAYEKFCFGESEQDTPSTLAVSSIVEMHPWCAWRVPSLYAYIQSTYWNVGAFKYYEWKQIPNFFLAAPVLALTVSGCARFFTAQLESPNERNSVVSEADAVEDGKKESLPWCCAPWFQQIAVMFLGPPALPHSAARPFERSGAAALVLQWAFLGLFAAICMNVQVSTRFLASACPPLHWWTASLLFPMRAASGSMNVSNVVRRCLSWYLAVYFMLGAVLHSVFLPWT